MRERTLLNVGLGGGAATSFVLWAGAAIFKTIGFVEWAQGLADMAPLLHTTIVNWHTLWFLGFAFGTAGLVGVNFDIIQAYFIGRRIDKARPWDAPGHKVVRYIADQSYYGDTIEYAKRYDLAVRALSEHLAANKLKAHGRKPGSNMFSAIDRRELGAAIISETDPREYGSTPKPSAVVVLSNDGKVLYEALLARWGDVVSIWPSQ